MPCSYKCLTCNSAAASAYCWLQTKGEASVYTGTALVERQSVVCSTATAGAVTAIAVAATTALLDADAPVVVIGGMGSIMGSIVTGFALGIIVGVLGAHMIVEAGEIFKEPA